MYRRMTLGILLIAGTAVLGGPAARADQEWYYYYELGLQRLREGNAPAAVENLLRAIERGPDPGPRRRTYGTFFKDFYPYLYLAKAYLLLNRCPEAQQALATSAQKEKIQPRDALYDEFAALQEQVRSRCERPPSPGDGGATKAQPPGGSTKTDTPTGGLPPGPLPVPRALFLQALELYAGGRYDLAFRVLQEAQAQYKLDDRAYFLMGCSLAARYYAEGERDAGLLRQARAWFRQARHLPEAFRRRMAYLVSPKIWNIYESS